MRRAYSRTAGKDRPDPERVKIQWTRGDRADLNEIFDFIPAGLRDLT
jgi:hypothetical protein